MKKLFFKSKILDRIEEATKESGITLFFDKEKVLSNNGLAVVFTQTIATQRWIKKGYYEHLGDFWQGSHSDGEIRAIVANAFAKDLGSSTSLDADDIKALVEEYLC